MWVSLEGEGNGMGKSSFGDPLLWLWVHRSMVRIHWPPQVEKCLHSKTRWWNFSAGQIQKTFLQGAHAGVKVSLDCSLLMFYVTTQNTPNWWEWVIWGQEESDPTVCPVRPPFTSVISTQRNHWSQALCSQLQTQMNFLKKLAAKASNNITGPFLLPRLLVLCKGGHHGRWQTLHKTLNVRTRWDLGTQVPPPCLADEKDSTQGRGEGSLTQTVRTWGLSLGSLHQPCSPRDLCGPMTWLWHSWRPQGYGTPARKWQGNCTSSFHGYIYTADVALMLLGAEDPQLS